MKHLFSILCSLILLIPIVSCQDAKGQNVALNKPYTVSVKPNYESSKIDEKALTNGLHANKTLKRGGQTTAVGWSRKKWVRINIDLEEIQPISHINFRAPTKGSKRSLSNVFILISKDGKNYEYVGDVLKEQGSISVQNKSKVFQSPDVNRYARYVSLVVIPNRETILCNGIEVIKGSADNAPIQHEFTFNHLWKVAKSLKLEAHQNRNINRLVKIVKEKVPSKYIPEGFPNNLPTSYKESKKKIGSIYSSYLSNKFTQPFIINKHNPWQSVSQLYEPKKNSSGLNYNVNVPLNGVQYSSFLITNNSGSTQTFSFNISSNGSSDDNIELFEVPFVAVHSGKKIVDPLVPIQSEVKIEPGYTKMVFIKLKGADTGNHTYVLNIDNKNKNVKIDINTKIQDLSFPKGNDYVLAGNAYPYLQKTIFKNIKTGEVVKNLQEHHNSVIPIRDSHYPGLKSTDFTKFKNYLRNYSDIKYVLVNKNYKSKSGRSEYSGGEFMSKEWKNYFKSWYANLLKAAESILPNVEVYYYPYDEIHSKEDIRNYKTFIKWAQQNVPGIKFYATLNSERAVNEILPLVDIAQIAATKNMIRNNVFESLPSHHAQVWIYTVSGTLRSKSPYKYFRLKGWKAFVLGATGIGFWNYASDTNTNYITSPRIYPWRDYSVIYNGPDQSVISSRRWAAFQLGIEDYQIIHSYAEKYGREKALDLVQKVLENSDNFNMANRVRNKMMDSL